MLTLPPLAACAVLLTCGIVKTDQHRTELNRLADCCWYLIQLLESTLDCCPLSIIMDWCISSGNSLAQTNDSHSNVCTKSWQTCDMLGLPCRVCSRPHFCFCFFNPFYLRTIRVLRNYDNPYRLQDWPFEPQPLDSYLCLLLVGPSADCVHSCFLCFSSCYKCQLVLTHEWNSALSQSREFELERPRKALNPG